MPLPAGRSVWRGVKQLEEGRLRCDTFPWNTLGGASCCGLQSNASALDDGGDVVPHGRELRLPSSTLPPQPPPQCPGGIPRHLLTRLSRIKGWMSPIQVPVLNKCLFPDVRWFWRQWVPLCYVYGSMWNTQVHITFLEFLDSNLMKWGMLTWTVHLHFKQTSVVKGLRTAIMQRFNSTNWGFLSRSRKS